MKVLLTNLAINILKSSRIPKSIGFIMDGNRRYATKKSEEKHKGHNHGFKKLMEVLKWSLKLGIRQITLYAFSVENFKRSATEVETIMKLAKNKFAKMAKRGEFLQENGIRVNILGKLDLLDEDVKLAMEEVVALTLHNDSCLLNICMAYNSTTEMEDVYNQLTDSHLILNNHSQLANLLYCGFDCAPDLIIRTSSEVRLSNFLLYQGRFSIFQFVDHLWPEFTIWDMAKAIIYYQKYEYNVNRYITAIKLKQLQHSNRNTPQILH